MHRVSRTPARAQILGSSPSLNVSALLVGMVLGKHIYAILFVILAVPLIGGAVTFTKGLSYRYRTEPNC